VTVRRLARFVRSGAVILAAANAAAEPGDIAATMAAGVWAYLDASGKVVVSGSFLGVPPDSTLRPAALAARRSFDFRTGDPVLGCGPPGMPRALTAASPMTFSWNGDLLTIRYESMDVERIVHMNGAPPPAAAPRTPNGHAVGRWDGDELIVETSLLDERVVDLLGTPKSTAMTLRERYTVATEGEETYLRVELTMIDPETFTAPYVWPFTFVLRPDWELMEYACAERPIELTPGVVPD
jgi:hypothetical protein